MGSKVLVDDSTIFVEGHLLAISLRRINVEHFSASTAKREYTHFGSKVNSVLQRLLFLRLAQ
jgi:hypothetical protein